MKNVKKKVKNASKEYEIMHGSLKITIVPKCMQNNKKR